MLQPRRHDDLHLYNSLTRRIEPFTPVVDRVASMYVCGITPYDVGHLGHALVAVIFDTLRRWLEFNAYEVRHIQNITDIDDDMVRKSHELGMSIAALTDRNQAIYVGEMDALNVQRPFAYPRVSETVPEIIAIVQTLIARGFAYQVGEHVFFDVARTPAFGTLAGVSGQALLDFRSDSMPAEPAELKRHPLDFLVWQPCADAGAMFESPWGLGRPGWHIECSAMALKALGPRIDIHGGGKDLRYPHHDSEIVQSESATGESPCVQIWMHNGTMRLDGVKMSKSLGNLVNVDELFAQGHTSNAIRLQMLATRYCEDRDFDAGELDRWEQSARLLERAAAARGGAPDGLRVQSRRVTFQDAMDDDLDTPRAIGVLLDIARELEAGTLAGDTGTATLIELGGVLGLRLRAE
ncbi:MAG: cysteine--tRNA ligase [Dehalococcoidia bacterium]|nr:cysteine--tRNA ligase [Dehalococcoidia bacterium]